jgi:hypothetical protein
MKIPMYYFILFPFSVVQWCRQVLHLYRTVTGEIRINPSIHIINIGSLTCVCVCVCVCVHVYTYSYAKYMCRCWWQLYLHLYLDWLSPVLWTGHSFLDILKCYTFYCRHSHLLTEGLYVFAKVNFLWQIL